MGALMSLQSIRAYLLANPYALCEAYVVESLVGHYNNRVMATNLAPASKSGLVIDKPEYGDDIQAVSWWNELLGSIASVAAEYVAHWEWDGNYHGQSAIPMYYGAKVADKASSSSTSSSSSSSTSLSSESSNGYSSESSNSTESSESSEVLSKTFDLRTLLDIRSPNPFSPPISTITDITPRTPLFYWFDDALAYDGYTYRGTARCIYRYDPDVNEWSNFTDDMYKNSTLTAYLEGSQAIGDVLGPWMIWELSLFIEELKWTKKLYEYTSADGSYTRAATAFGGPPTSLSWCELARTNQIASWNDDTSWVSVGPSNDFYSAYVSMINSGGNYFCEGRRYMTDGTGSYTLDSGDYMPNTIDVYYLTDRKSNVFDIFEDIDNLGISDDEYYYAETLPLDQTKIRYPSGIDPSDTSPVDLSTDSCPSSLWSYSIIFRQMWFVIKWDFQDWYEWPADSSSSSESDNNTSDSTSTSSSESDGDKYDYLFSGSLTPDATGTYIWQGNYLGYDYYSNGDYYLWWTGYQWTVSSNLGDFAGAFWLGSSIIGSYSHKGTAVGDGTMSVVV